MDFSMDLMYAARDGDVNEVKRLIDRGGRSGAISVNIKNWEYQTALHLASRSGHANVCEVLLTHGADVHAKDQHDKSPLHYASENGHIDVVKILIEHGGDVNMPGYYEFQTALHLASRSGHANVCEVLLTHGSDVHAKDQHRQTALHFASKSGHKKVCEILLKHGADVHAIDLLGHTACHYASYSRHVEVCMVLIKYGAGVQAEDHMRTSSSPVDQSANYKQELLFRPNSPAGLKSHKQTDMNEAVTVLETADSLVLSRERNPQFPGLHNQPSSGGVHQISIQKQQKLGFQNTESDGHQKTSVYKDEGQSDYSSDGYSVSGRIDENGGNLFLSDFGRNAGIHIPRGAISNSEEISFSFSSEDDFPPLKDNELAIAPIVECRPDESTFKFDERVEIVIPHYAVDLVESNILVWYKKGNQDSAQDWILIGDGTDHLLSDIKVFVNAETITLVTSHFCNYCLATKNGKVDLTVMAFIRRAKYLPQQPDIDVVIYAALECFIQRINEGEEDKHGCLCAVPSTFEVKNQQVGWLAWFRRCNQQSVGELQVTLKEISPGFKWKMKNINEDQDRGEAKLVIKRSVLQKGNSSSRCELRFTKCRSDITVFSCQFDVSQEGNKDYTLDDLWIDSRYAKKNRSHSQPDVVKSAQHEGNNQPTVLSQDESILPSTNGDSGRESNQSNGSNPPSPVRNSTVTSISSTDQRCVEVFVTYEKTVKQGKSPSCTMPPHGDNPVKPHTCVEKVCKAVLALYNGQKGGCVKLINYTEVEKEMKEFFDKKLNDQLLDDIGLKLGDDYEICGTVDKLEREIHIKPTNKKPAHYDTHASRRKDKENVKLRTTDQLCSFAQDDREPSLSGGSPHAFYDGAELDFEGKQQEFKKFKDGANLTETILDEMRSNVSAFANTEGGRFLIGIDDNNNGFGIVYGQEEKWIADDIYQGQEFVRKLEGKMKEMIWIQNGKKLRKNEIHKSIHWDVRFAKVRPPKAPKGYQLVPEMPPESTASGKGKGGKKKKASGSSNQGETRDNKDRVEEEMGMISDGLSNIDLQSGNEIGQGDASVPNEGSASSGDTLPSHEEESVQQVNKKGNQRPDRRDSDHPSGARPKDTNPGVKRTEVKEKVVIIITIPRLVGGIVFTKLPECPIYEGDGNIRMMTETEWMERWLPVLFPNS